ncbi:MAG: hypothetical protein HY436_02025 [Candidatus Liptonbacteria bacterium]|nr:hypothetical protein [Candidatus Liptonbacteria bacterium]
MTTVRILTIAFEVIIWTFVPLIVLLVLAFSRTFTDETTDKAHKDASRAGFWAGILLFAMTLIYQVGIFIREGFPREMLYQGFSVEWAAGGAAAGFLLFAGRHKATSPRFAGLEVLLATSLSLYVLLHYFFIRTYNAELLSVTLGLAFGALVHFASAPGALQRRSRTG